MLRCDRAMGSIHRFGIAGLVLVFASGLSACADGGDQHACVNEVVGELVASAQSFKLDVYGSGVTCTGNAVPKGAVAQESATFTKAEAINLDIGPGHRTLVLTTFADADASLPTGS